jgi:dTDP-glucose pyrophosphorylase
LYNWKNTLLKPNVTMEDAINILTKEALRIAIVVDAEGGILGIVTDGDIRRALLRGCTIESPVSEFMHKNPVVASSADSRFSIVSMMKEKDLLVVPIVNKKNRVVGVETLKQLLDDKTYDNPVFLMAGGLGKRLSPLTDHTPKPLLKVGSKPILETILEQFSGYGFHNFYISVHYKADMLKEYFGDGKKWGINIHYLHEKEPLGTAGSIGLLPDSIPNLPVIVMNGDLLTKVNFERLYEFHEENGGSATMCVREYDFEVPYGIIESEGSKVKRIVEKPVHSFFVNAGIYIISPNLARSISGIKHLDMPSLLNSKLDNGEQVNVYPVHEYWVDIGRMEEYQLARENYSREFKS